MILCYIFLSSEVARQLRQFDQAPYNSNLVMLIALLNVGQTEENEEDDKIEGQAADALTVMSIQDDEDEVARVKFEGDRKYAKYAANVYIASWKWTWDEIAKTMEVEVDDILFTWFDDDDKEHCPKFMVLIDHDLSSVVIIIRGTFSFKDVVMDVVCEEVEFQDGFAHKGFLEGSQAVLGKCREILETALSSYPEYQVVVCGHSMGGATAQLVTMQLLCSQEYQHLLQGLPVRCVALGSPPVFRSEQDLSPDILENINIYLNSQDVVPSLSIGA